MIKEVQGDLLLSKAQRSRVGGMEWTMVKPQLEQHLGSLGIPVYVYSTFHSGVAVDEARATG